MPNDTTAMRVVPQKLGKYEVRRELGRGGMGVVYEGFDPIIHRRVALKTLTSELFSGTEAAEFLTRLQREAQAGGRLNHPNIVAIYDFGEVEVAGDNTAHAKLAFIAMEFVEGRELKSILDAGERFEMSIVVKILSQLLDALEYSHAHGVIHRDIKPANIMLLADGSIKVADFGIARIDSSTLTQVGTVLGSPSYMSPEQFLGQTVDRRSDLYSAAVVLYQLLTGETPFSGSFSNIMHRVLNDQPSPASVLNVHVPRAIDTLLRQGMAKRPADRFQSAAEFKQALLVAAASENPQLTGESTQLRAPETARPRPTVAGPKRGMLAAIVAGIAVAVAAGGYYWVSRPPASTTEPAAALVVDKSAAGDPPPKTAATPSPPDPAVEKPVSAPVLRETPPTAVITALGLADQGTKDPAVAAQSLWQDARRQLIAKAAALYIDPGSLNANYPLLRDKLLEHSDSYITKVIDQSTPQATPSGLWSGSLQAEVNVRDVQKALNKISRDQRIEFIRNNGNPRIAVDIRVESAVPGEEGGATRSQLGENLLTERIRSFGFVVVDEEKANPPADFLLQGAVRFKRLSARLPASGITIEKFVLTSWTVRATETDSGEQIYYNTKIPDQQSWATQERALQDVGKLIGAEFSRDFFLQYFHFGTQRVRLRISGLPPAAGAPVLEEMSANLSVLNLAPTTATGADFVVQADLSLGTKSASQIFDSSVLAPLNRKAGKTCFVARDADTAEVRAEFLPACTDPATLSRLEGLPPQALMSSSAGRIADVTNDPTRLSRTL